MYLELMNGSKLKTGCSIKVRIKIDFRYIQASVDIILLISTFDYNIFT